MQDNFGWRLVEPVEGRAGGWEISVTLTTALGIVSAKAHLVDELDFEVERGARFMFMSILSGRVEQRGVGSIGYRAGEVFVGNHPRLIGRWHTRDLRAHVISLPLWLINEVAGGASRAPGTPWRLLTLTAVEGGAARWHRTIRFVDALLADPDAMGNPLVTGAAARLVAATALSIFPNTAVPAEAPADRRDARPQVLRRALAFIDANPHRDISVADIARAAYVTPRAIQLAFRRYLGTTPMGYLRQIRLAQARQALLSATRGDGNTVARIAGDWGFSSPSRFAEHYRTAYGEPPSRTLAR